MNMKENNSPLVSIVVPVYKTQAYLSRCVDSLLAQTYPHLQVVLIDDGSPDNSGAICDEYARKDSRVLVVHIPNGGVSNARNTGLNHSCGEYVMFVDSDDKVSPHYVEHLLPIKDEDMVSGGWICYTDDNPISSYAPSIHSVTKVQWQENFTYYWSQGALLSPWGKCFKKCILDRYNIRFDTQIDINEDELFNLSYLQHCNRVRYTDTKDYLYTVEHGESLMQRYHECRLTAGERISKTVELIAQKNVFEFRWMEWHSILNHYNKYTRHGSNNVRSSAKAMKKITYDNLYFRESILYMRTNGSLDQKVETFFMKSWSHWMFTPLYALIITLSKLFCRHEKYGV